MAERDKSSTDWVRLSGIGFELVGAVAGFGLIGFWIDHRYATRPWGVLVGVGLGIVGGMYTVIREALQASKEADRDAEEEKRHRS